MTRPALRRKGAVRRLFARILRGTIGRLVTVRGVYALDLSRIEFVPEHKGWTIEQMNLCDLDLMYSINREEIHRHRYEDLRELAENSKSNCYMVKNGSGDICGYYCLMLGKGKYDRIFSKLKRIRIEENGILTRDYTFKRFRRQGVYTFSIHSRLGILRNKGYRTATIRIAKGNIAAEKTVERFGFRKSAIELHFHLFNLFPLSNHVLISVPHR